MKTLKKIYIKPRSTAYDIPTEEELLAGSQKPAPAAIFLEYDEEEEYDEVTPD